MSTFHRLHRGAIAALMLGCIGAPGGAARAGFDDLDRLVFVANRTAPEIAVVDSARDRVMPDRRDRHPASIRAL